MTWRGMELDSWLYSRFGLRKRPGSERGYCPYFIILVDAVECKKR